MPRGPHEQDTRGHDEPAARVDAEATHGFRDYHRVLARNRHFRLLWCAEMVDNVGSWLSYVATLELASQLSGGSGLALSVVVLIRFLPSLVLAPVCGVVADRWVAGWVGGWCQVCPRLTTDFRLMAEGCWSGGGAAAAAVCPACTWPASALKPKDVLFTCRFCCAG